MFFLPEGQKRRNRGTCQKAVLFRKSGSVGYKVFSLSVKRVRLC